MNENVGKSVVVKAQDKGDSVIQFKASDETPDRDGDIIRVAGWDLKNWMDNPLFLWGHNKSAPPIGKGLGFEKTDDGLIIDVAFAQKGKDYDEWPATTPSPETLHKMYKGGFLNAVSVGFRARKYNIVDDAEERQEMGLGPWGIEYLEQELTELSAVTLPANPNALQLAFGDGVLSKGELDLFCAKEDTQFDVDQLAKVFAQALERTIPQVYEPVFRELKGFIKELRNGAVTKNDEHLDELDLLGFKHLWGKMGLTEKTGE